MDLAQGLVRRGQRVHQHAQGEQVVDALQIHVNLGPQQLAIDAVEVLGATGDLGLDPMDE